MEGREQKDEKDENKRLLSPKPSVCRCSLIMDSQIFVQSKQNKNASLACCIVPTVSRNPGVSSLLPPNTQQCLQPLNVNSDGIDMYSNSFSKRTSGKPCYLITLHLSA